MSEMIERVARAIATADEQNGAMPYDARISLGKHARAALFDQARAAIEAMREPTREMRVAFLGIFNLDSRDAWSDVIDEALK